MMKKRRVDVWMHKGRYIYIYMEQCQRVVFSPLCFTIFFCYMYMTLTFTTAVTMDDVCKEKRDELRE